jgi:hypothetical protein
MDNEKPKPRSLVRIVLVVSLALNVAVIGAVAGMALSGRSHAGDGREDGSRRGDGSGCLQPPYERLPKWASPSIGS